MRKFVILFFALFGITGCAEENTTSVEVKMFNPDADEIGTATIQEQAEGVEIEIDVKGLEPGVHGFHIHETGKCEGPDFKSAGGHYNPDDKEHGRMNMKGHHAGDLPNLTVKDDGSVKTTVTVSEVTLKEGKKNTLLDKDGASLVIHADPDDGMTDPAGNAGNRVACGEIIEK